MSPALVPVLLAACAPQLPFLRQEEGHVVLLSVTEAADALGKVDGRFEDCGAALRKVGVAWTRKAGLSEQRTGSSATFGIPAGSVRAQAEEGVMELRYDYAHDRATADLRLTLVPTEGKGGAAPTAEELKVRYPVADLLPALRDALRCDDPEGAP